MYMLGLGVSGSCRVKNISCRRRSGKVAVGEGVMIEGEGMEKDEKWGMIQ